MELNVLLICKKKDFNIEIIFGFKNTVSYKAKNCQSNFFLQETKMVDQL